MRQNSKEITREMISMEEYLKKRQEIREKESKRAKGNACREAEWDAAWELAELMYI